jgi:hypothetical protein
MCRQLAAQLARVLDDPRYDRLGTTQKTDLSAGDNALEPAARGSSGTRPAGNDPCARHRDLCAYDGTEPDRCGWCHSTWTAIDACDCRMCRGTREEHARRHEEQAAVLFVMAIKRGAKKALVAAGAT